MRDVANALSDLPTGACGQACDPRSLDQTGRRHRTLAPFVAKEIKRVKINEMHFGEIVVQYFREGDP